MKTKLDIKLSLNLMLWQAEPRNILETVRAYCPFISGGEVANRITELAVDINNMYQSNGSAKELDTKMLELKQLATGVSIEDAKMFGFIQDYSETLSLMPYFRGQILVDTLPEEELTSNE
ncbi:hypothetical protein DI392_12225 [Vibrio albus]|uniref:Uncharacterized protein n=1 Tax=Vibrio albus TaxID=2200953 RepID=A0A2U3B8F0_9VIBR|nr:hypothetical protein [Vibrio albus]PWI33068.1 hypothetical protein DI392_12225 [Vibrio albus]